VSGGGCSRSELNNRSVIARHEDRFTRLDPMEVSERIALKFL
jgi:hypothetical protein